MTTENEVSEAKLSNSQGITNVQKPPDILPEHQESAKQIKKLEPDTVKSANLPSE